MGLLWLVLWFACVCVCTLILGVSLFVVLGFYICCVFRGFVLRWRCFVWIYAGLGSDLVGVVHSYFFVLTWMIRGCSGCETFRIGVFGGD